MPEVPLLVSPSRAGRGVIARILRALIDSANDAGPALNGLGSDLGLAPLLGKSLAVISDARFSGPNSTVRAIGITACMNDGGTHEYAATMTKHASTRATQLDDRRRDEIGLDDGDRIGVRSPRARHRHRSRPAGGTWASG